MYNTKRLLGTTTCVAAMFAAMPAFMQQGEVVEDLLDSDTSTNSGQQVAVGETGEIELHVKDLEITTVLQLLSIQAERNIIASRGVEGATISADLYGVSFDEALNSILMPNGFGYIEEGNFIYVMTREDILQREEATRQVSTVIHRLDYIRADEAAAFVSPMLSSNGSITASGNVEDGIDPSLDNAGSNTYSGQPVLVIRDYEQNVEEIVAMLEDLDTRPKQVIIETTVLRATLSENNQFGVDFSLFSDLSGASPLDIIDGVINGGQPGPDRFVGGQSNVGDVVSQSGGVKLGFVAGDASVFVSALDAVTDTTLIATPNVTVLDRQRTSILVGEKIAYLSTTVTQTSETQTVEFLEIGTQLNVRPFVASDGTVRLELRPSVSDATIRTIGTTSAPDQSTVELTTNVIVESGQTIVLGGLITDDTSINRSQVPGLGDVPFFGAAFQGHNDTIGRSEVIFLVKATVVDSGTESALGREAMSRIDVARVAEREQTLIFSRSRNTAAHFVNARRYYDEAMGMEEGETREAKLAQALMCVDMALHLNPSMVDALMLREQITGEASYLRYEESIVTSTYNAVLDREIESLDLPALPEEGADAGDAENMIEPEPLTQAQPAEEGELNQAEADAAWLEAALNAEFSEATAEADAEEVVEAASEETTAQADTDEVFEAEESADWHELSTAELLRLATEASEQADADNAPADNATADAPTETD